MDIKKLKIDLSVTPQVMIEDLPAIRERGFRSIICNRPDGEGADQPTFKEIEATATKLGLNMA